MTLVQGPLGGRPRVSDVARRAPHERQWRVPGLLKPTEGERLDTQISQTRRYVKGRSTLSKDAMMRMAEAFMPAPAPVSAGYSAQTFGLGDAAAVTATEVTARERRSMITRGMKARYWAPAVAGMLRLDRPRILPSGRRRAAEHPFRRQRFRGPADHRANPFAAHPSRGSKHRHQSARAAPGLG